jgi:hypothetical protein
LSSRPTEEEEDEEAQLSKYKKCMMQRYLHDSVERHQAEAAAAEKAPEETQNCRKRKVEEPKEEECCKRAKSDPVSCFVAQPHPFIPVALPPVQQPLPLSLPVLERASVSGRQPSSFHPNLSVPSAAPGGPMFNPLNMVPPSPAWIMGQQIPVLRMLQGKIVRSFIG